MLKKSIRFIIIALIQVVVIGGLILCLAPALLNNTELQTSLSEFFQSYKVITFVIRLCLYLSLYFIWPYLVGIVAKTKKDFSVEQVEAAIKGRWPLIGCLLFIELLYWVR